MSFSLAKLSEAFKESLRFGLVAEYAEVIEILLLLRMSKLFGIRC